MSVSWWSRGSRRSGGPTRKLRGGYKIPLFVRDHILADGEFRAALRRIADSQGQPIEEAQGKAERYLTEIAAGPSRFMVGLSARLARFLYRRAYGTIHYDREFLDEVHRLGAAHPIVFLPCHRSNMDRPVLHYLLWKNHLPPTYTAGGINMNFFPVGPISRRAGVFFIRRTFTDNLVYKLVLQTYMAYLIENRLHIEWYIEGGRSRTGKLGSPRYGLLGYTASALAAGKSDDIYLIPTSINYDHVLEVDAYTAEQSGNSKEKETFGWMVRSIRSLRRRYGNIHVRFGKPVSMRSMVDPARTGRERRHDLRALASEVCMRINRATPITPISLVVVALLSDPERALSARHLEAVLGELVDHAESTGLPSTEPLSVLRRHRGIGDVAADLADLGIVTVENRDGGTDEPERAYRIGPDQQLAASYYRNTIIHFFLPPAIAELGLVSADADDMRRTFRDQVMAVKDLFRFEFFFSDDDSFLDETITELDRRHPRWEEHVTEGFASEVLERLRPHRAPWVLRSFVEAYLVVADELVDYPTRQPWRRRAFMQACLSRSARYVSQGRIGAEAVSLSLFANAVRLAADRDLLEPGPDDLSARREAFATELDRTLALIRSLDSRVPAVEEPPYGRSPRIRS